MTVVDVAVYFYMKELRMIIICASVLLAIAIGYSDANGQDTSMTASSPATPEARSTMITKEALRTRLADSGVQFIEKAPSARDPNPLFLLVKVVSSSPLQVTLNGGPKQSVDELRTQLRDAFKTREENGIVREGTNEIDKRVTISASDDDLETYARQKISVEDIVQLIDALSKDAPGQIAISFVNAGPMNVEPPNVTSKPARKARKR